jgi:dTDP-4-dehydrorhamnose reductase
MKRIYIAGSGGMLGEAMHKQLMKDYTIKCTDIDLNEDWLSFCDFRDYKQYEQDVFDFKPDLLIHLGAHTDLEYCEKEEEDCYKTNTLAVENACFIANKLMIPIVYISTAGIFHSDQDTYDDWDTPSPRGNYARSKYLGEKIVQSLVPRHFIFRAGWMMGGGPKKDKKFINKIIQQIVSGKKVLHIVNDKFGTPTYTHDFAKNALEVVQSEMYGIYNMVCDGLTSRLDVAQEVIQLMGLEDKIDLVEVTSEHFQETYFAPRPLSERLINRKLDYRNMNHMRNWKLALREYLADYYS